MLSSMQKVLRSLLVGDDEVIPARGCSRADGVAEPTSPPAPLVGSPSQRSEFNDPGDRPPPHSAKRHPAPLVRRKPTGRAANVALEPAPAAPDTTLALAPRHDTMTRRTGEYWDTAPSPASAAPPSGTHPLRRRKPTGRAADAALTPASWHPTRHRPSRLDATRTTRYRHGSPGKSSRDTTLTRSVAPPGRRRTADEPGAPASLATAERAGDRW